MCQMVITSHNHLQITAGLDDSHPTDGHVCSSQWQILKSLGIVAHQLQCRLPSKLLSAEWKGSKDADSEHAKTASLLLLDAVTASFESASLLPFHSAFSNLAVSLHCSWCATIPRPSILTLPVAAFNFRNELSLGKQLNAQVAHAVSSCFDLVSDTVRGVEPVVIHQTFLA